MADVRFEETNVSLRTARRPRGIAGLIIRSGLAKDETGANIVMIFLTALALLASAYLWTSGYTSGNEIRFTDTERRALEATTPNSR